MRRGRSLRIETDAHGALLLVGALVGNVRETIGAALAGMARPGREVTVDLSGIARINQAGLQALVALKCGVDCDLRFINHSAAVLRLLESGRLFRRPKPRQPALA